jgi:diguanylate cyclase (GGDEF)-like protein
MDQTERISIMLKINRVTRAQLPALLGLNALLAVKGQLSTCVEQPLTDGDDGDGSRTGRVARELAVDCVSDFDRLERAFSHERARRCQLELEVFDARAALAQLRSELAGSRAGERHARYLALHDSLTSLPNARYFFQRLTDVLVQSRSEQKSVAVFFIDLDDFKPVNDAHGHSAGDELLSIIATRLTRLIRCDDMVGRMGGDEFACLLLGLPGQAQLSRLACKVFDAISAPIKLGDLVVSVRPSIGVSVYPGFGETAEGMLHQADVAMYRAKREQTGYAIFDPSMGDDAGD